MEPVLLESYALQQEGTTVRNPVHSSQRAALLTATREANEDPPKPKLNKFKNLLNGKGTHQGGLDESFSSLGQ